MSKHVVEVRYLPGTAYPWRVFVDNQYVAAHMCSTRWGARRKAKRIVENLKGDHGRWEVGEE